MNFPDPNLAPLLIVDDSQDDAFLLRYRLRMGNIANPVTTLESPREALGYLQTQLLIGVRPELLFVDINTPGGMELINEIRADPEWDEMKIVVITYSNNPTDLQRALESRIDGYLLKFPDADILAEFVRHGPWFYVPRRPRTASHALVA